MSYSNCTEVSAACPVAATTYGYVPNLSGNVTLLVVFAICGLTNLGLGIFYRGWSFMVALTIGCFMEAVGYAGRILMHNNVWDSSGLTVQIVCLILAPSFIAAGVYLSLKHIILYLGPQYSRIQARYYTWIFISFDAFSILTQPAGGGIAGAAGKTNPSLLSVGNDLMIAGIAIQVVTMSICGLFAIDFIIRYSKRDKSSSLSERNKTGLLISHKKAKVFFVAEVFAYITILIRCIYRLPEMAGGWGNPLMQNETEFLILDGMMVALASITFTVLHPGIWFPPMTGQWKQQTTQIKARDHELSSSSSR